MKPEDNYQKYMEERVLPYILPRREEQYLEREPGKQIYCAFYTAGPCNTDSSASSVPDDPESSPSDVAGACKTKTEDFKKTSSSGTVKGIILISHGFTESADKYFEVIYHFLRAGYHVCIPEHCGHGRTYRLVEGDPSLVYVDSWQRYVDDLKFIALTAKKYWSGGRTSDKTILTSSGMNPYNSNADTSDAGLPGSSGADSGKTIHSRDSSQENEVSLSLPLYLFAHSMGGGIGAALTAKEPHLFSKVVLSSPMVRPLTGVVPWPIAKGIVAAMCAAGKETEYVIGQHGYDGKETLETSCATSAARHAWYKVKTDTEPLFQMYAASYGWLREAIRLNRFLMDDAWQMIEDPVMLVQAEHDNVVSKDEQVRFIHKLAKARQTPETAATVYGGGKDDVSEKHPSAADSPQTRSEDVRFVRMAGAKHEIFRSDDATVEKFLRGCLEFI
ncbi:MAG: alpha/beta hydrolase [Lachnospiraceae bacterium]|nr:alpha/beta hydrolase [Lachnospiraceae bacterium]